MAAAGGIPDFSRIIYFAIGCRRVGVDINVVGLFLLSIGQSQLGEVDPYCRFAAILSQVFAEAVIAASHDILLSGLRARGQGVGNDPVGEVVFIRVDLDGPDDMPIFLAV